MADAEIVVRAGALQAGPGGLNGQRDNIVQLPSMWGVDAAEVVEHALANVGHAEAGAIGIADDLVGRQEGIARLPGGDGLREGPPAGQHLPELEPKAPREVGDQVFDFERAPVRGLGAKQRRVVGRNILPDIEGTELDDRWGHGRSIVN